MAKWTLFENKASNLTLKYDNVVNGEAFNCGELRSDTPEKMVVEWIVTQEAVQPFDVITLPGGKQLHVVGQHGGFA